MEDENLKIYEKVRSVPDNAKKAIGAGRLKGMTDINPMWRIKKLTETFGACGIGWWYVPTRKWMEECKETGEIAAFVDIDLYYVWEGKTSQPIHGTGGASFVTNETKGLHLSDECYKMALTDAISVAAKALGVGADVYWDKDFKTKYSKDDEPKNDEPKEPETADSVTLAALSDVLRKCGANADAMLGWANRRFHTDHKSFAEFTKLQVIDVMKKLNERAEENARA